MTRNELKEADRLIHAYRHSAKRWQDKSASQGHTLAENYCAGRIALVCDLDVSVSPCDIRSDSAGNDEPITDAKILARLIYCADVADKIELILCNRQHVLVDNVEVVEIPENGPIAGFPIPSVVRLYLINDDLENGLGSLMFQSAIHGGQKLLSSLVDQELAVNVSSRCHAVQGVVESGPQVVDRIAENKQDVIGHRLSRTNLDRIISTVRIVIDGYGVRAVLAEGVHQQAKLVDVLIGPL